MHRRIPRAAACIVIALLVPLTLVLFAFGLPAQYGETYLAGLPLKWDRLREAEGPRIILVGGSGAAFDVRCDLLEQALPGYQAVNFGLYAGLGTTVMLDLVLTQIRAGDVVVFMPELSEQTLSTFFGPEAMWQAADGRWDLLPALTPAERTAMLAAFPAFAAAKMRLYRDDAAPAGEGVYARASFDRYGDIAAPGRERNVMPGGYDENMPLRFDPALPTDDFCEKLNAATAACEKAGARLYFLLCPMNAAAVLPGEEGRLEAFCAALEARLDCELLGDPAESVMAAGWFFDTNFHLNESGAAAATAFLAADLAAALGRGGSASLPVPEMPALAETALLAGDDADKACFLYEKTGDGYRVTGLTEAGTARETLTVPVSRDGLPVVGFDAAAFANNARLRELILQENIRSIPDGAFSGCAALERLTLRNPAPEACTVGRGLLEGTDALIYVPADRVSAYCTSYFWAMYAGRIRADGPAAAAPESTPAPVRPGPNSILYDGNGGVLLGREGDTLLRAMDTAHLRVNTLQGASHFRREGYVLLGWSRDPAGGERIGLGSRTERAQGLTLYAQWAEASPAAAFRYERAGDEIRILGYLGGGSACVVPESIDGLPVRRVCAGAFQGESFDLLVFPSSLRCVEPGAFQDCAIEELTFFDSLREIGDDSFAGGLPPRTLRINAAVSPVYCGSYYATFADKLDRLLSLGDTKKLVLASGSSGRYGYDSAVIDAAFPAYEVVNMGVYAYSNARPQLDLILGQMEAGDILLSAPEFDAVTEQFCVSDRLDHHFWAMMEADYDTAARLDMRAYSGVFDSFAEYQRIRGGMEPKSYDVSPAGFDDDGNRYDFPTYNQYGDFILPRPNGQRDERQHANTADYTTASFPPEVIEAMNAEYEKFLARGVDVYFSYTPRNRSSLTEESTPEARAALDALLRAELCVPVISEIEDYLYSGIYFWKIDSHTSTEGAEMRTRQLVEDLRRQLGDAAETGAQ